MVNYLLRDRALGYTIARRATTMRRVPDPMINRPEDRRRALRRALDGKGMNPAEACRLAKVGPDAVHNFLRGETSSLNLSTLEPLAVVLEVTVSELIGDPMLSFPGSYTPNRAPGDH